MAKRSLALCLLGLPAFAAAVPDFSQRMDVAGITVVRDREAPRTFYFLPNAIEIATADDGGPRLAFTVAVYTGSVVHGDQGERRLRASFYARVRRADHDPLRYRRAADELVQRFGPGVVLREIPVSRLDAKLVYAGADGSERTAAEGFFEPADGAPWGGATWQERDVFLALDPVNAQLVEHVLENGDPGLTLSYAFHARAWVAADAPGEIDAEGIDPALLGELAEDGGESPEQPAEIVVQADALPIRIAAEHRAARIERYHLESTTPPNYASLVVYCFDFRDALREDLYEKAVVIEASGAAGGTTRHLAVFGSDTPEIYARTVRFPFAVDLRKPYRWRAEEVLTSGELKVGDWIESASWVEPIDATGDVTAWNERAEGEDL